MTHRIVTDGLEFPEGPIALPDGSLLVVEIAGGRLTSIAPDGAKRTVAETGGGPAGAAIGPDGMCYVCNSGGFEWEKEPDGTLNPIGRIKNAVGRIERVDLKTGNVAVLYEATERAPLTTPDDIVFDRDGGFWFTDLGLMGNAEAGPGRVCYAKPDGSHIQEVVFPMLTPNGIGLSPDERTLYVAETETTTVWAFDIAGPGKLTVSPYPTPGRVLWKGSPDFWFDSLAIEESGNICVATLFGGCVTVLSPAGELIETREMPDRLTTNICFGGPDLKNAFVTLSGTGRLVEVEWSRPGLPLNFLNK
ncbi:SMP-30/gluconolactonase/LRE family protein [Paraburkholderia aspalathi]|uniref:SMP-30/gluconolactonase/LRE family protein n=1 Tax=Paraburkholderia aspalathi TaxID=1324617 RepID=UPI003C82C852